MLYNFFAWPGGRQPLFFLARPGGQPPRAFRAYMRPKRSLTTTPRVDLPCLAALCPLLPCPLLPCPGLAIAGLAAASAAAPASSIRLRILISWLHSNVCDPTPERGSSRRVARPFISQQGCAV